MSTRTKSMTHFTSAVNGYVDAQLEYLKKTAGLAETLFTGVCELWKEEEGKDIVSAFNTSLAKAEDEIKDKLPDGVSLSAFCSAFRVRKSEIKRCLKAGLDPTEYSTLKEMLKKVVKKDEAKPNGGSSNHAGEPAEKPAAITAVSDNMPPKVREALNRALKTLANLSEEQALACVEGFENNASMRLRKAGGRYSNVNKAVS